MTKDLCETCVFSNWIIYPKYNEYEKLVRYEVAKLCLRDLRGRTKKITRCKHYQHQYTQQHFKELSIKQFILRTTYKEAKEKAMVKTEEISEFITPSMIKTHGHTIQLMPNTKNVENCGWIRKKEESGFERDTIQFETKFVKDGLKKQLTMNKTTFKACAEQWGDDSDEWVNNKVKLEVLAQMVRGEKRNVIYGTPITKPKKA